MRLITTSMNHRSPLSLLDDFVNSFYNDSISNESRLMPIDVLEYEDKFVVKADMPGVDKENLKVTLKSGELLIESCEEKQTVEEKEVVHHSERFIGCYQRIIRLPETCDEEKIAARLDNGVLTVSIPKVEPKPRKQITIE